jgi:hypothetical protein
MLLFSVSSAAAYYSKFSPQIQLFCYVDLIIFIFLGLIAILADESVSNFLEVKPPVVRGVGILTNLILLSSGLIYAFALHRIVAIYFLSGGVLVAISLALFILLGVFYANQSA